MRCSTLRKRRAKELSLGDGFALDPIVLFLCCPLSATVGRETCTSYFAVRLISALNYTKKNPSVILTSNYLPFVNHPSHPLIITVATHPQGSFTYMIFISPILALIPGWGGGEGKRERHRKIHQREIESYYELKTLLWIIWILFHRFLTPHTLPLFHGTLASQFLFR